MTNDQTLSKLVDKILTTCKNEYKVLEKFIDSIPEFSLPTYEDLKDPELFLNQSRTFTQISTTNHFHKIKISKIMIDISTMINELSKYQLNSINQKEINDLKQAKDKCNMYINTLDEYQRSINQVIDYFKLYSYTVNTPYAV